MGKGTATYGAVDIGKFVAAILVVAIHVLPFSGDFGFYYDHCIARIADPFFFIATSFFMFRKAFADGMAWRALGRYMRRIAGLYAVWVAVYSPIILYRTWEEQPPGMAWPQLIIRMFFGFIRKVFLTGPYGALWFLTALLLAIPLTFAVTKLFGPAACLALSAPFYLFTALWMEYTAFVGDIPFFQGINHAMTAVFGWLGNGLTYGFFFCALGMYAAYTEKKERSRAGDGVLLAASVALLALECTWIRRFDLGQSYGAMVFLIPAGYYLFQVLRRIPLPSGPVCLWLRKSSILIFTIHYGVMEALGYALRHQAWYMASSAVRYAVVLAVTAALAAVIIALSKRERTAWLGKFY